MKVLVILRTYRDVFQEKSIAVEAQRTDTLHGILRNAIQKAGWNENELRTRSIRVYDEDFEDYVDVGEDERPVDFGRYEVLLQSKTGIEVAAASQTRPTAATNIARFSAGARQTGYVRTFATASRSESTGTFRDMPVEFYVKSIAGRTLTFKLLTKLVHIFKTLVTQKDGY